MPVTHIEGEKIPNFMSQKNPSINNNVRLFLAAMSDGQKKAGVEHGPQAILQSLPKSIKWLGMHQAVDFTQEMQEAHKDHLTKHPNVSQELLVKAKDADSFVTLHRPDHVGSGTEAIFKCIKENLKPGEVALTLGGDHSIAIGSITGVQSALCKNSSSVSPLLVVWVDAHMDFHSPLTTPSGNLHGCPVGFLMDLPGSHELSGFQWLNRIDSVIGGLLYIGLRDVEREELEHAANMNSICMHFWIQKNTLQEIKPVSYPPDLSELLILSLKHLDPEQSMPIHLSIDIDALDPAFAPSTGTPVPHGLSLDQCQSIIRACKQTRKLVGMDLVEVNPEIGSPEDVQQTLSSAIALISKLLAPN